MIISDKASFFAVAPKPRMEEVNLPDGSSVYVREVSAGERDKHETRMLSQQGKSESDIRARWLVACACDSEGKPLFDDSDIPSLTNLPANFVEIIVNEAYKVNAISQNDLEELKKD